MRRLGARCWIALGKWRGARGQDRAKKRARPGGRCAAPAGGASIHARGNGVVPITRNIRMLQACPLPLRVGCESRCSAAREIIYCPGVASRLYAHVSPPRDRTARVGRGASLRLEVRDLLRV